LNRIYFRAHALAIPKFGFTGLQIGVLKMLKSRTWLKIAALAVFSSAALCFAVLAIILLAQDKTAKAGIATLTVRISLPFLFQLMSS